MEKFRTPLLATSAFVMLVTVFTHIFLGGPEINDVVQASNLAPEVKATVSVVWHMTTALLVFMFVCTFVLIRYENSLLAASLIGLEAVFAGLFFAIGAYTFSNLLVLPQWTVFTLSAVLALPALSKTGFR